MPTATEKPPISQKETSEVPEMLYFNIVVQETALNKRLHAIQSGRPSGRPGLLVLGCHGRPGMTSAEPQSGVCRKERKPSARERNR